MGDLGRESNPTYSAVYCKRGAGGDWGDAAVLSTWDNIIYPIRSAARTQQPRPSRTQVTHVSRHHTFSLRSACLRPQPSSALPWHSSAKPNCQQRTPPHPTPHNAPHRTSYYGVQTASSVPRMPQCTDRDNRLSRHIEHKPRTPQCTETRSHSHVTQNIYAMSRRSRHTSHNSTAIHSRRAADADAQRHTRSCAPSTNTPTIS